MNKENMTFEEATKVLLDELKNNLAALHKKYEVRPADWSKMHEQLLKVVSEETQIPYAPEEVVEVRPRELECDVVRYQNNKEKWVALLIIGVAVPVALSIMANRKYSDCRTM